MPRYQVDTNMGSYEVELNRPPASQEELMQALQAQLGQRNRATNPTPQGGYWNALKQNLQSGLATGSQTMDVPGYKNIPDPVAAGLGLMQMVYSPISAAGQVAGEKASDLMKGTPLEGTPSDFISGVVDVGTNYLLGAGLNKLATAGTGAVVRKVGRDFSKLPNVALNRRTAAAKEAEALPQLAAPPTPSEPLYSQVGQMNPEIPLDPLRQAAKPLTSSKSMIGENPAHDVANKIANYRGTYPKFDVTDFQTVRATMKDLNDKIGAAKAAGGEGLGELLQLKKGMWEALEKATDKMAGPAAAKLREANMAWRNEYAMDKTAQIIAKATKTLEGREGEAFNLQAARALDALKGELRKDKWLEGSFPPGALERITNGLDKIRQMPLPGAPQGVDAGSKQMLSRVVKGNVAGGLIGTGVGYMMGSPGWGAAIGSQVGAYSGIKLAEILSTTLAQPKGLELVQRMMKASPQGLTPAQIAVLAVFARGSTGRADLSSREQPSQ